MRTGQSAEAEACLQRCAALLAAYVTALGLVGWDVVRVLREAPTLSTPSGAALFVAIAWSLGALLLGTVGIARAELGRALRPLGPAGLAFAAVLDVGVLFSLCVVMHNPTFLDADQRALTWVVPTVAVAAISFYGAGLPERTRERAATLAAIVLSVAAVAALAALRAGGPPWLRLALHLIVAASLAQLASTAGRVRRLQPLFVIAGVAVLLVACATPLLAQSPWARSALHQKSVHALAWATLYERLADRDGDGAAGFLGGRDCDEQRGGVFPGASERPRNGIDENCDGRDGDTPALLVGHAPRAEQFAAAKKAGGAAAGSDVLILSIDALRWDRVDDLRLLTDALGPHARFATAVSPAPGTRESLAATSRGRPVRSLRIERAPSTRRLILWRDGSPTLGHRLLEAGYRTLTVPTSNIADPRIGVLPGFDSVWVANFDARARLPERSPLTQRYVAAEHSFPIVLSAARATPNPLCVWLHVMETHAPYHLRDERTGEGLEVFERYVRSLRETSARLGELVRAFTAARGGKRPIVAVFGDHGEEFGEHGSAYHASTVYAEQVRVGFLLAGPGVPAARFDAPVSTTALPATVLDLLGLDVPASMIEPSLLPAMHGTRPFPELAVSEMHAGTSRLTGYTHARYRYLHDPVHDLELVFDSQADPYERDDLSASRPDVLASLRKLARAWDEAH